MDKIILQRLHVQGILGVHEWEREQPREIVISLTLFTDTRRVSLNDDLRDSLDYSLLATAIRSLAERAHRRTVEALAEDLAAFCLDQPGIQKVIVRVDKPGAVSEAETVAVEIERP